MPLATVNGSPVNSSQYATAITTDSAAIAAIAIKMSEVWGRLGLDSANPLLTNQTNVTFGTVSMTLTGNETSSTLTRQ